MKNFWHLLWSDDSGQDLAEYALLIALIALVVILAFPPFAQAITGVFTDVGNALSGTTGGS
jgi:Flp pilus assembly pilin Flp